jgi:MFS family permease
VAGERRAAPAPGTAGGSGASGAPGSAGRLLGRHPDFRRLFLGTSVSLLGSSVTAVALPLTAVVFLHASPGQMGLLGALALLPHLVLGLPAGAWVERAPYRRILVTADLAQGLLLGAIPLLAACGLLRMWQLGAVAVLAGAGNLFETVTAQSFTPLLVPRDQLLPANSALMLSTSAVGTTGAALGGVLVSVLTAPYAIVLDALSFLGSAACKARIGHPGPDRRRMTKEARGGPGPSRGDLLGGLRAVLAHPVLRPVLLAATLGALAGQLQNVVLVLYLVRELRLAPGLVGAAVVAGGVAAVLGALAAPRVTRRLGPGRAFVAGMLVASLAGLVLATAPATGPPAAGLAVVAAAQLLRGAGPSLYGVNQQTLRQTLVAPALLSRVNAAWRFLVYGMQPLGALLGGLVGGALGLRAALVAGSCAMLLGTGVAAASPALTGRSAVPEEGAA